MDREKERPKTPDRYPGEPEPNEPPPPFQPLYDLIVDMEGGTSAEQRAKREQQRRRKRSRR